MTRADKIDSYIKDYELGDLEISAGGNFQEFLNLLIQYFQEKETISRTECTFKVCDKNLVLDVKNGTINKKVVIYADDVKVFNIQGE